MKKILSYLIVMALSVTVCGYIYSAAYNKQRVRSFDWKVLETENFYIHYYDKSEPLLKNAVKYIEKSYRKLIDFYKIEPPDEKVPFFLFAEHNEFEQTNIVSIGEGTGGVTEAFKNRLLIFNDGSQTWLENVIIHEMTHIMEFYILYGGFWKSVRLLKSFFYPLWVMEGLAEYGTGEIDRTTREMYIRDAATSGGLIPLHHLHNFNHLKPHQVTLAYKQSEMVIRFLADEYGIRKVIYLLQAFKTRFDSHTVLTELIGIDLFKFGKKFIERLEEEYAVISASMDEPDVYGKKLTVTGDIPVFNTNPLFSPDGKEIIYMGDKKGYLEIYAYNIETGKHRRVMGQKPRKFEYISSKGHAFSVSPSGRYIAFAAERKQKDFIFIYDTQRKKLRKLKTAMTHVKSPCFSPDGSRIVFIGMHKSITDIYSIDLETKEVTQLTDDEMDDRYPVFSPDGKNIVYSKEIYVPDEEVSYERDLYMLNLETGLSEALVSMPRNENDPSFSPDGLRVYFINDQHDVNDIYSFNIVSGEITQLTAVIGGNFSPSISPDGSHLVFSSFRRGNMDLFLADAEYLPELAQRGRREEDMFTVDLDSAVTGYYEVEKVEQTEGTRYRFKASTDLFFPVLFYSSLDGLFAQVYYQASEMLGNHQFLTNVGYASGADFLNYNVTYAYSKFKPRIFLGSTGRNYYEDFAKTERRTKHTQFIGVSYPLSRFGNLSLESGTIGRTFRFKELNNFKIRSRENFAAASYVYDITSGKYLETLSGYRYRITYEFSDKETLNSDFDYRTHIFEGKHYLPLGSSVFTVRMLGGVSVGDSPGLFRLGGVDRLRGFSRNSDEFKAHRAIMANAEIRIPLTSLNYYTWFFFPDFFFKRLVGVLFSDTGFLWETNKELRSFGYQDLHNSVGIGLRFYTFILQTFRLDLSFDWARRTSDGKEIFYFSLGPEFYFPVTVE